MDASARWFGRVMWLGIAANMIWAASAVLRPAAMIEFFRLDPATPFIWVRFAGWLLILLSLFYVPAAMAPGRASVNAWLSVAARFAGAMFFLSQIAWHALPSAYLPFGLTDLIFGVAQLVLLFALTRRARWTVPRTLPQTSI